MKLELRDRSGATILKRIEIEHVEPPIVVVFAKRFFAMGEVRMPSGEMEVPTEPYIYVEVSGVVLAVNHDLSPAPKPRKHSPHCATFRGRLFICDCSAEST